MNLQMTPENRPLLELNICTQLAAMTLLCTYLFSDKEHGWHYASTIWDQENGKSFKKVIHASKIEAIEFHLNQLHQAADASERGYDSLATWSGSGRNG
jgi:hypothetical protein